MNRPPGKQGLRSGKGPVSRKKNAAFLRHGERETRQPGKKQLTRPVLSSSIGPDQPLSPEGERGWGEGANVSGAQPPHPRPLSPGGERGEISSHRTTNHEPSDDVAGLADARLS